MKLRLHIRTIQYSQYTSRKTGNSRNAKTREKQVNSFLCGVLQKRYRQLFESEISSKQNLRVFQNLHKYKKITRT